METSAGQGARGTGKSVKGRIRKIPSETVIRLWRNFFVTADDLAWHLEEASSVCHFQNNRSGR